MPFGRTTVGKKATGAQKCTLGAQMPHCRFGKPSNLENNLGHGFEVGLETGHDGVTG